MTALGRHPLSCVSHGAASTVSIMFRTPRTLFRTFAFAEVVSWTLLIAGLITRPTLGWDWAVSVGGGIHGFVFLCYGTTVVLTAKNQRWSAPVTLLALVSAVVPYATIPAEIWLDRSQRLTGGWRLSATTDPRDASWHDRLFRILISHPVRSGLALAVFVVIAYVVLLTLGPPVPKG